jgi:acyl-CoA synthetase (AMP-forming)/AMP-acid ligase II
MAAGRNRYATCTFGELDADATALARGLAAQGVAPGMRLALLVPPGIPFVKLVFALLRSGATTVLVDPGMGRQRLIDSLAGAAPDGFIAVSRAQAIRSALQRRFPRARMNVTVGRRWFWGGRTLGQVLAIGRATSRTLPTTQADELAAIVFTSGSTGPPKGVLYTHQMFETQVAEIQRAYQLQPGGVDLACFALFGLFNSAMGVTTVFPAMNFSRPASAQPRKLLRAANDWHVTQAFASPTVWDKLSRHCERTGARIPSLRKAFSCGAPVPAAVLRRTIIHVAPGAEMHTPYGATEALPVSTIEAREILDDSADRTAAGAGVCVGRRFESINWRVIRISDGPLPMLSEVEQLPSGEIGELIVHGPQVSRSYLNRNESDPAAPLWSGRLRERSKPREASTSSSGDLTANVCSKVFDGDAVWHRIGDVGYLDAQERFWYCGRKTHRVQTPAGALYTECCEAVFNQHPAVRRCALVGDGAPGIAAPVIVVESSAPDLLGRQTGKRPPTPAAWEQLVTELLGLGAQHAHTAGLGQFLLHASLPVDVRHNAKINREQLAVWASRIIADRKLCPHPTKDHVLSISDGALHSQPRS